MIVTRHWLNEWIDLSDITTEHLAKTFNAIGLEVDRVESYRIPEKIVVGRVAACEKHSDADKLNVCQVDLGGETRQIVCGAPNVAAGQYVPVAAVGAVMPGGLEIKPVKLRGVDSAGMICSATELGLPKVNDGILVLDESIGALELGKPLADYLLINDDLIEIELTANRGDCLSIRGVARDLCAALDKSLKPRAAGREDENRLGIGRLLKLDVEGDVAGSVRYHAVSVEFFDDSLLMTLRLAMIDESRANAVEGCLEYAMHTTGVILRAYPVDFFRGNDEKLAEIVIKREAHGLTAVYGQECASIIGIRQEDASRLQDVRGVIVIEASYIAPEVISQKMAETKLQSGPLYYRTSRGSEPELSIGSDFLFSCIEAKGEGKIYGGTLEHAEVFEPKNISIDMAYVSSIVGTEIDKSRVANILKNLGFDISKSSEEQIVVSVPRFRHDIVNRQDLIEEIVRIVGIDNIPAKPFVLTEADRIDDDYFAFRKKQTYRQRAAQSGFYESVHFVFNEREQLDALGLASVAKELSLLNPIAGTLDTLRPTLLAGLLNAASSNAKNGRKRIPLFEIGSVFDVQRRESVKIALLFAGTLNEDSLDNSGKPESVSFESFSKLAADVLGDFTLKPVTPTHKMAHPYQAAAVYQKGLKIGEMFTLHPTLQAEMDLPRTVMFEGSFDALAFERVEAKPYSKYQASHRDLSILMPQAMAYAKVAEVIEGSRSGEIVRFYPVDRYTDETLGDQMSLTLRFVLQSQEKTLEEEEITAAMEGVLAALQNDLGVALR
ncbi:phenylalanine--tRNA ligase subunit beta [Sulfurimonas sp. HSL1-6]|uniref:phenylalanine--tRNA ligase subunit beta n=1 Tax=Thiomicrolovo immobilis TaxID=3131935 RepID=UPI0031F95D9D